MTATEDDAQKELERAFDEGRYADLRRAVAALPKDSPLLAVGDALVARTKPRAAETALVGLAFLLLGALTTYWFTFRHT